MFPVVIPAWLELGLFNSGSFYFIPMHHRQRLLWIKATVAFRLRWRETHFVEETFFLSSFSCNHFSVICTLFFFWVVTCCGCVNSGCVNIYCCSISSVIVHCHQWEICYFLKGGSPSGSNTLLPHHQPTHCCKRKWSILWKFPLLLQHANWILGII